MDERSYFSWVAEEESFLLRNKNGIISRERMRGMSILIFERN